MSSPIVSIVVPYYNRGNVLGNLLTTVFQQTLDRWELLIVDDASSTPLRAMDDPRLSDPRVRLLRHERNAGASAARNTGLSAAEGRFVAFLDSDDQWMPGKLAAQVEAVEACPEPAWAFCLTRTLVRTSLTAGRTRPARPKAPTERFDEYIYIEGGFAQTSSFFLSAELAHRLRFRSELRQYEDHLFFIDAGAAGARYVFVDDVLTIYNDMADGTRLSSGSSLVQGDLFLDEAGDRLSPRARLAFQVRYLGTDLLRAAPGRALLLFGRALLARAVKPRYLASLLLRIALPQQAYRSFRARVRMSKLPS